MTKVYYEIEIEYATIQIVTWIPYTGELTGINDWWNAAPMRFSSYEDALKAIHASETFRDGHWRIVKTTTTTEVIKENLKI